MHTLAGEINGAVLHPVPGSRSCRALHRLSRIGGHMYKVYVRSFHFGYEASKTMVRAERHPITRLSVPSIHIPEPLI